MIDIETMGTQPNAVILSIGACSVTDPAITFYEELGLNQAHRTYDGDTFKWWMQQERAGNRIPFGTSQLAATLQSLAMWLGQFPDVKVWAKGTDFDCTILRNAYESLQLNLPWKYNNVRDCRTIFKLLPLDTGLFNQTPHNALADAQFQSRRLMEVLKYYRLTLE